MIDRRCRLLLVEDSQTQVLRLQHLFEQEGYEVVWAEAAAPALAELERRLPDLIVLDYYLPDMRGDELCRRIRRNINQRNVPVLILTADETAAAEEQGLQNGADACLSKTVEDDVLLVRMRSLLRAAREPESVLAGGDPSLGPARLLAVDDSPTYLEYLSQELARENYRVEQAPSGAEALERLRQEPFDCVLLDLAMPGLDGIEVCRRLTDLRATLDNPPAVLMLTARDGKEDLTQSLEAGADDLVGKSSDLAVLKARLRAVLCRKFFQQENRRILEELKNKELETVRARADQQTAETRALLADQLAAANRQLQETNRRLQETQMHLVQSEKMASLGQLVAGLAHEMNNPLAFVLSHLDTVEREAARITAGAAQSPDPAARRRIEKICARLQDMREGLERVRELVTDLRTFSRLDEGKFNTIDIRQSIDSVLRFLQHRMENLIRVEKHYGPRYWLSCYAGQLNQVLMNVLANAVDAIQGKGTITITTGEQDEMFTVSVRDTGPGIPPEIRHRIFEPFFTTKPVGQGTGLGLAISYSIVQAHGGSIDLNSPSEGGTEFVIRIPLALEKNHDHGSGTETTRVGR